MIFVIKRNRIVRISAHLYGLAKAESRKEKSTVSEQVQHWATIGKAGLDNPDLPIHFVCDLLQARKEDKSLIKPSI